MRHEGPKDRYRAWLGFRRPKEWRGITGNEVAQIRRRRALREAFERRLRLFGPRRDR